LGIPSWGSYFVIDDNLHEQNLLYFNKTYFTLTKLNILCHLTTIYTIKTPELKIKNRVLASYELTRNRILANYELKKHSGSKSRVETRV